MNVSVDLAPEQLSFLKAMLKSGSYRSRSEIVRDIIRRAEFEWEWKKGINEAADAGISEGIKEERKKAYQALKGRFKDAL